MLGISGYRNKGRQRLFAGLLVVASGRQRESRRRGLRNFYGVGEHSVNPPQTRSASGGSIPVLLERPPVHESLGCARCPRVQSLGLGIKAAKDSWSNPLGSYTQGREASP